VQELLEFFEPVYIVTSVEDRKSAECIGQLKGYQRLNSERDAQELIFLNPDFLKQDEGEASILLPTSGTTGKPKIVQISLRGLIFNAKAVAAFLGLSYRDRFLSLTSLSYCHGFYNGILMPLINGASAVIIDKFDVFIAARIWNILSEYSITVVNIVPSMIKMILNIRYKEPNAAPSLRFFICGTAKLQEEDKKMFENKHSVSVFTQFGTTESLINTINKVSHKPDAQGVSVGCEIVIVDTNNSPLPCGEMGEITVSGNTITRGYFKNEELTHSLIKDSCLFTGDLGYVDQDGFLHVKGRKKEMINRGGFKVFPEEVDRIFRLHETVAEVCTVGLADQSYGEEIYTFLVLKKEKTISLQQLYDFLRDKLPKHKTPKEIIIIDAIPKGPTGKPKLQALRERLLGKEK
jgi:long-chain acyl-CoA synthetase